MVDWGRRVSDDRPLVIWADNDGGDLVLAAWLIGQAADWAPEFLAAVHGMDTHGTRPMITALAQGIVSGARDLTKPTTFPRGRAEGRLRAAHQGDLVFAPVQDAATAALWALAEACHIGADTAGGAGRFAFEPARRR